MRYSNAAREISRTLKEQSIVKTRFQNLNSYLYFIRLAAKFSILGRLRRLGFLLIGHNVRHYFSSSSRTTMQTTESRSSCVSV